MRTNTVSIQRTSKPLKAHLALATFLFWFALLSWFLPHGHFLKIAGVSWSSAAMIVGALWNVGARAIVWWEYG